MVTVLVYWVSRLFEGHSEVGHTYETWILEMKQEHEYDVKRRWSTREATRGSREDARRGVV